MTLLKSTNLRTMMYYENQIADESKWARWPDPKSPAAKGSCCYWGVKWHEQIQDNGHNGKQWTRNRPGCVAHAAWSTSIAFFQRAPFSRALTLSGRATFTSTQKGWQKLDSTKHSLRKTSTHTTYQSKHHFFKHTLDARAQMRWIWQNSLRWRRTWHQNGIKCRIKWIKWWRPHCRIELIPSNQTNQPALKTQCLDWTI